MTAPMFRAITAPPSILQDLDALGVPRLSEDGLALLRPDGTVLALQCAPIVFDPPAGDYVGSQDVTLTCDTPGASMFYTTDGSDPTPASTAYTVPIATGTGTVTIKAIALRDGYLQSQIGDADYIVTVIPVTLDPATKSADAVLSDGNLTLTRPGYEVPATAGAQSTVSADAGKIVFAWKINSEFDVDAEGIGVGITIAGNVWGGFNYLGKTVKSWGYYSDGNIYHNNVFASIATTIASGGYGMMCLDLDAGKAFIRNAGGYAGNPVAGTGADFLFTAATEMFIAATTASGDPTDATNSISFIFAAADMPFAIPAGYAALA
jgi:hypothetical protein